MNKFLLKSMAATLAITTMISTGVFLNKTVHADTKEEVVKKVCKIALDEVGYIEKSYLPKKPDGSINYDILNSKTDNAGSGNITKYAQWFADNHSSFYWDNKQSIAWCDVFVDWCMCQAFGYEKACTITNQGGKNNRSGAGCIYSEAYYADMGRLYYSNPQVGDQIFFKSSQGHTGLIVKVNGNQIDVVEGNSGPNTDRVVKKTYFLSTANNIKCYGRPKYELLTTKDVNTTTPANHNIDREGVEIFVTNLYKKCLGRQPSTSEVNNWANAICNGGATASDVVWQFFSSQEFKNQKLSKNETITRLYRAVLGREPDSAGYKNWVNAYNNGASLQSIVQGFVNSAEFQNICDKYNMKK